MNSFKRMLVALIATAFALIGASTYIGTPAHANQAKSPTWTTTTACVPYNSVSTCAWIAWHQQADGTGVVVDQLHVWTPTNCGDLESPAYSPVQITYYDGPGVTQKAYYDYGNEGCDITHYPGSPNGWVGYDTGNMRFHLYLHARIPFAHDKNVDFEWRITPDGNDTLLQHQATACPCAPWPGKR